MSEDNPTQKKFRWQTILIWAAVIVLLIWALPELSDRMPPLENPPDGVQYSVVQDTYLYSRSNLDSRIMVELKVGDIVMDPYGNEPLTCKAVQEAGETVELCRVLAVEINRVGWMLKMGIE